MTPPAAKEGTRERILHTASSIMARKGFSGVGINEVLLAAAVPKGSFYHYFSSKDAFGEAMLQDYFDDYFVELDRILAAPGLTMAQRLMNYWEYFSETQESFECQGKCLVVKLGAEVSDLSEPMRMVLRTGTNGITARLAAAIAAGVQEGSIPIEENPDSLARTLYQMWLGASVMSKIHRNPEPLANVMALTVRLLRIQESAPI
jgi:TetR/AcrR family transcriptional regulator, transcriptional repressor for nem operon